MQGTFNNSIHYTVFQYSVCMGAIAMCTIVYWVCLLCLFRSIFITAPMDKAILYGQLIKY